MADAVFNRFKHAGVDYAVEIQKAHIGPRFAADDHIFHMQMPVFDLAPDKGRVGAQIFREPFARSANDRLGLRFGYAAFFPAFYADKESGHAPL
ncbi:hypothetical protein SDC9_167723 [bioreactor metagenome]|uniref:Uncharacterized protein n=1 Tax=bioreactor metagenome TaxID=1076179 RepID=A0A645G123_9ZZZZ